MHHMTLRQLNSRRDRADRGAPGIGRSRRAFGLESLESRVLLAGNIFVTILHDANGNGLKDPEEPALAGWDVFVDLNHNRTYDAGEPLATTDIDGVTRIRMAL